MGCGYIHVHRLTLSSMCIIIAIKLHLAMCMEQNWILKKITQNKYKLTEPRKKISTFLKKKKGIFCAQDIIDKLQDVDRVSIYRALELMEQLGIITPLAILHGQQYYEKHDDGNHHHHIICTRCKKTKCVDCKTNIPTIKGFSNINHSLVLTGLCNSCR